MAAFLLTLSFVSAGCNSPKNKRMFEGRKSSREYLDMALESKVADERRRGVVGLAKSADGQTEWAAKVFDTLARTDTDAMVRCAALRAMSRCNEASRVETCTILLTSPVRKHEGVREAPPPVRWNAANLLLHVIRTSDVTPEDREMLITTLIERIRAESDHSTRLAMLETLGYFPERRVIEALIDALVTENFAVAHTAELSLASLTGVTHDHDVDAWRAWLQETQDPFASAGHLPESIARELDSRPKWDLLEWWE
ncbi:MAG: HEAT repeat domain-containing protein [Planctomycetes bacterium]|nr:HEAT repeat domain-containing protein [Planctomycetota bacterium]